MRDESSDNFMSMVTFCSVRNTTSNASSHIEKELKMEMGPGTCGDRSLPVTARRLTICLDVDVPRKFPARLGPRAGARHWLDSDLAAGAHLGGVSAAEVRGPLERRHW